MDLPIIRGWLAVGACSSISISVLLLVGARSVIGWWVAQGLTTSGHGRRISARDGATGSGSVGRGGRSGRLLLEHGPIKRIVILMIQSAEKDAEQLPQVHVVGSLLKPKSSGKGDIICVKTILIYFISGSETLPLVNGL